MFSHIFTNFTIIITALKMLLHLNPDGAGPVDTLYDDFLQPSMYNLT